MKFKRILLKLSGEALMGEKQYGIDIDRVAQYAKDIQAVHAKGIEIALVIGGGNIYRGLSAEKAGMDRVQADYMDFPYPHQRSRSYLFQGVVLLCGECNKIR